MIEPWQRTLRAVAVPYIAERLGLEIRGRGPWSVRPCPCCGQETRGGGDRRGPVYIGSRGDGWRCYACEVGGDAAALIAARVVGRTRGLTPDDWQACRETAEGLGLIEGRRREVRLREIPRTARVVERPALPGPRAMHPALIAQFGGGTEGEILARAALARAAGVPEQAALQGAFDYVVAREFERGRIRLEDRVLTRAAGVAA